MHAPIERHDVVRIHQPMRDPKQARTFTAWVSWVERRETGWYFGYVPDDPMQGAWGCSMLYDQGKEKPFSATVTVVGHCEWQPESRRPNLFRNPGYDLVNM